MLLSCSAMLHASFGVPVWCRLIAWWVVALGVSPLGVIRLHAVGGTMGTKSHNPVEFGGEAGGGGGNGQVVLRKENLRSHSCYKYFKFGHCSASHTIPS
ncbi:hypothetical protein BDDG_12578 [Blastomyces dermatitidis ATCC 18188]|uniref:Uncharacterized protein n=1 Tax=Ajellomyces dermatitidis (strain ATCC 18188 / CBS 674.68) TaxID=653446 RepID=A0A0J9EPC1_AJEDA|nr:hypothetical protein BDDG_12578 [Blastomyces dermatitidis ATCC 18188]